MQPPMLTPGEDTLNDEVRDLAGGTVEEAVNGILDARADELASAERYERTDERQAYRSGHYSRGLLTQAGKIEAGVPKLRGARLAAEVIERHGRRESSVEEALMETCPLGVSTRNVEDVTRILWDEGLSAGTAVKRNWGGAYESVAVLVAIGADPDGRREAVGVEEGHGESEDSWRELPPVPGDRGLSGAGPAAGDKPAGMLGALSEALPGAERRRRAVRSCRNVLAKVPSTLMVPRKESRPTARS